MDKIAVLNMLKVFKSVLEKKIIVNKMILFGSFAKNTQREDSDVDVAVVSKDFEGLNHWERIEILTNAIYEVFEPIEAVAFSPEEWERNDSLITQFAKAGQFID